MSNVGRGKWKALILNNLNQEPNLKYFFSSTFARGVLSKSAFMFLFFCTAALSQPSGGVAVTFTTQDVVGGSLILRGQLWEPTEPAKGSVVLVHGSGGWSNHREGHYGRALSAAGYAVLAIDTFGPREISGTVEDQAKISSLQMTRDAFAARRFLLERGFAPDHMAVMGFSKGGVVALYAADRNFLPEEMDRFAAAIPFYPGCNARPRVPKPASVVFMVLGEKDDYTGTKPCQDIADDFSKAGGNISVKIYPSAAHAFDGNPANTSIYRISSAENYMDCIVYIEENGSSTYAGNSYTSDESILIADLRKTCMKKGASVQTNIEQKAAATRDVIDFLNNTFTD